MSDSTPKPKRAEAAGFAVWWLASLGFHAVLIGWLVWFPPVHVSGKKPAGAAGKVGGKLARQVIGQIREKQAGTLARRVENLRDIRRQLATLEARKKGEYQAVSKEFGKTTPGKAAASLEAVVQAQQKAADALKTAGENSAPWVNTRANTYYDTMAKSQESAREAQTAAAKEQEKAGGLLAMGDSRFSGVIELQNRARDLQENAARALVAAEEARGTARSSRKRTKLEGEIEHYTYNVRRVQRDFENAPMKLKELGDAAEIAGKTAAAARLAADEAAAGGGYKAGVTRDKAEAALTSFETAKRRVAGTLKSIEDAKKDLPELEAKVKELMATPDPEKPEPSDEDLAVIASQQAAIDAHAAASRVQAEVRTALDAAMALPATGVAVKEDAPPPAVSAVPDDKELAKMDISRIYQTAVGVEAELTESYRQLRATELAMIRQIPISRALELTEVTKAVRPDLQKSLDSTVSSGEEAVAAREAIQSARSEISSMVQLGTSLLSQARSLDRGDGTGISMDTYQDMMAGNEHMESLATEMEGVGSADLTAETGGGDGAGEPGGSNIGGAGSGGSPGGAPGGGPGGSAWFKGGSGMTVGARGARIYGWPARRVAASGPSAPWFYVDSWYVIGPFDNARRANVEKKFPPETTVDLNAVYPGRGGVPIRWEFQQSGSPNVMPQLSGYNAAFKSPGLDALSNYRNNLQFIIYYAYSEIWFDRECDLWVSIGSDDYSKVWLNDQIIWASGKTLKAWKIDEGKRKVHFKQGINKILARVENGNDRTEFSFVVFLK